MQYCSLSSEPLHQSLTVARGGFRRQTKKPSFLFLRHHSVPEHYQPLPALLHILDHKETATEEDVIFCARLIKEENLFPQFSSDLKVLRVLVNSLKGKTLEIGQCLLSFGSKDQNLYRVVKGEMVVRRGREGAPKTRVKGDLVESYEECRSVKDIVAVCKEESTLLEISRQSYREVMELSFHRKKILQMMSKTSLMSAFKRREIIYLLEDSSEMNFKAKEVLFQEDDPINEKYFFLAEGELAILKHSTVNKGHVVCYMADGSFVGEEVLFGLDSRTYTATVHSNQAKLLVLTCQQVQETIEHFKLNRDDVLRPSYKDYLQMRDLHYREKIEDFTVIKDSFHQTRKQGKMSPVKQTKILNLLRDIQNSSQKLNKKEKLMEKRYKGASEASGEYPISVEHPLFVRQDFPGLRKFVKRCNIFETRARQNCKLPTLL